VEKHLGAFIQAGKLPGKLQIEQCINAEKLLKSRSWRCVKDHCRNSIKKLVSGKISAHFD
jgi:hypothetical protein